MIIKTDDVLLYLWHCFSNNLKRKEELNWIMRLFTLGDRFDLRDFYDRLKKSTVEFAVIFFGILMSFGVEQQWGKSEEREDSIENLNNLKNEIEEILVPGLPLGSVKNADYDLVNFEMNQGDVLVLISDGLPECDNYSGEMLDYEAVKNCIYENGNKSQEGLYDAGKQEGDWIWYYQSGIKKEKTV